MKTRGRISVIITAVLICAVIVLLLSYEALQKRMYPLEHSELIEEYAHKNGVSPELVAAVIYCESSFDENAVSRAGAVGLMQLMPDTYDWLSRLMGDEFTGGEISDAETNISCGCYYLGWMVRKFRSEQAALAGYNAGHGIVSRWMSDTEYSDDGVTLKFIPYRETEKYVEKVLKTKEIYKNLYYKENKNDS